MHFVNAAIQTPTHSASSGAAERSHDGAPQMKPFLTLHHPRRASQWYANGHWQADTFYSLLQRQAQQRPQAIALADGQGSLSWQQLLDRSDALAADFAARGIAAGARVSIWMSSRVEAIITFLACSRAGVACNPSLHKTYTCAEIVDLLAQLQSSALVTEAGWGADGRQQDIRAMLVDQAHIRTVYHTLPQAPLPAHALPARADDPDAVAYLAFTSGTTGKPKCVMHSANTLLANCRDMVADWSLGSDAVMLSLSPLSHHIAWVAIGQWLCAGCQLVTNDPPHGTSQLDWLLQSGASYVLGVPTHAMDILAQQQQRGLAQLGQVKTFYMAGAPIPPVVAEALVQQGIKPQNVYGMTENSSHQYTHPGDSLDTWISTCGRGGTAYQVKIFDSDDPDLPIAAGETGQIGGRGPALMLGYYDNQLATENSFNRDGWFMSGDLGSLDAAGNLKIEGRLKDLIIRGGHNIYPSRIEALALRHHGIDKATAYPIADPRLGEKVCLAIIGTPDAGQLLAHLASQGLSKYDMPEYFVRVDELPLTASGKILKRELIAMTDRKEIVPQPVRWRGE